MRRKLLVGATRLGRPRWAGALFAERDSLFEAGGNLPPRGLINREISGFLKISAHTVKAHVAGLLEALDLTNRTEAAVTLHEYETHFGAN